MSGIVLAGGKATRLHPTSLAVPKSLHPVYNKPMFFYPCLTLYEAGIEDILLITSPEYVDQFESTFSALTTLAPNLEIRVTWQERPAGIADAFNVADNYYAGQLDISTTLILGDNIFLGEFGFKHVLSTFKSGARIWGYRVPDPSKYGVLTLDTEGTVTDIVEKPSQPETNLMVPGLYTYDDQVFDIVKNLKPSARGELEITDVNKIYLESDQLVASEIPPEVQWWDCGNHDDLSDAAVTIKRYAR